MANPVVFYWLLTGHTLNGRKRFCDVSIAAVSL
jgi:hypothetical protein